MLRRNGRYGLAEVYVRCQSRGYSRSFESMCRQIRNKGYRKVERKKKSYTKYENMQGTYPGEKVQVDIKYVPQECIRFPCYGDKYYQITAIDEYSRKRVLKIVKEKSIINIKHFPLIFRQFSHIPQHCAVLQCSGYDSRYIERFFTFGFADGCAEITQCPNDRIMYFKDFRCFLIRCV